MNGINISHLSAVTPPLLRAPSGAKGLQGSIITVVRSSEMTITPKDTSASGREISFVEHFYSLLFIIEVSVKIVSFNSQ